jgi:hypothetical protein
VKVTINAEFTDDELKKHAADVGRRWIVKIFEEALKTGKRLKIPPGALEGIGEALASALGAKPGPGPVPPPGFVAIPVDQVPFSPPSPGPDFAAADDRCMRMAAGLELDEGWVCCHCDIHNGLHRPACRRCGHGRCDIVIPPPPRSAVQ